jgi:hypothetical protein
MPNESPACFLYERNGTGQEAIMVETRSSWTLASLTIAVLSAPAITLGQEGGGIRPGEQWGQKPEEVAWIPRCWQRPGITLRRLGVRA